MVQLTAPSGSATLACRSVTGSAIMQKMLFCGLQILEPPGMLHACDILFIAHSLTLT